MNRTGIIMMMALTLMSSNCNKKGCTDPNAINYDSKIKQKNSSSVSCIYAEVGPTELDCNTFNTSGTVYELQDLGLEVDYIVNCKMPVKCDLKVMPGVTIEFSADAGLQVNASGSINAIATTESPILFTGVNKVSGSWAGIYVESTDINNKIDGCTIEYAGGDNFNSNGDKGAFILYANSSMEISNTSISKCANYGINANYGGCSFSFQNNTITSCTMPIFIAAEYGGSISGGSFTGNTTDAIYIDTYGSQADITTSQTWSDLNVPYRAKGGARIQSKSDWVIAPGVEMEFEAGSGILVNDGNSLNAIGTTNEKIIFRGVNPGPGAWKMIYFNGTNSLNEIAFAEINGGGEDPTNTKGTVFTWYNAKLYIHDVSFTNNLACGVYVRLNGTTPNPNYSSSNLTFSNNTCDETFGN